MPIVATLDQMERDIRQSKTGRRGMETVQRNDGSKNNKNL
jgi:hypothetical protein